MPMTTACTYVHLQPWLALICQSGYLHAHDGDHIRLAYQQVLDARVAQWYGAKWLAV